LLIIRWLEIVREGWPRLIIGVLGLREIRMISPTGIVGLEYGLLVGLIHGTGQCLMRKKNRILFEHIVHSLTVSTTRRCELCKPDLVQGDRSVVSKSSSLRVIPSNLTSYVMDISIKWRPLFEEIGFTFLDSSRLGSQWRIFSARSLYISHPSCSSVFKNLP